MSTPKRVSIQQDFAKIPVIGLVAEQAASAPTSPTNGQVYYDTGANRLKVRENGAWVNVSETGSVLSTDSAGGDISGTFSNLQIGAGAVGATEIADGTITDAEIAAANKDGTAGTASMRTLGTGATQAAAGNHTHSNVTDGDKGDITVSSGTWTIDNLAVTAAKIANATITDTQIAAANKDGAAGTASLRTLGTGAAQALAGNTRLDQITVPTAAVSLNSQRITNLATPTAGTDAVNKNYADSLAAGFDPKASVRLASTANQAGTYNATGGTSGRGQFTAMPSTFDGVALAAGDRILLKDQTTGAQNGIWVVTTVGSGANGVWDRAPDFDADAEVTSGAFTFVEQGSNDNSGWVLATNNPITIGGGSGTVLTWVQFSAGTSLTAGAGLSQTGNTFDVNVDGTTIEINTDILRIKDLGVTTAKIADGAVTLTGGAGQKVTGTLPVANGGTGATTAAAARTALTAATGVVIATHGALSAGTELLLTHNLGTKNIIVKCLRNSDDVEEEVGIRAASNTQVGVTSDVAYAADTFRFVVLAIGV